MLGNLTTTASAVDRSRQEPAVIPPRVAGAQDSPILSVESIALAAQNDGTAIPHQLIYESPEADALATPAKGDEQPLVPLPPAGWTGVGSLLGLAAISMMRSAPRA
jgi:hypothetical protein